MKVFLDTNVIIDFYARREDFFQPASILIDLAYKKKIDIIVSSLTFVNAFFILRKTYHHKEDLFSKLRELAKLCIISKIDESIIKKCLQNEKGDFEDAVQYESSKTLEVDIIITRNPKHFKEFNIKVQTPLDFLASNTQLAL